MLLSGHIINRRISSKIGQMVILKFGFKHCFVLNAVVGSVGVLLIKGGAPSYARQTSNGFIEVLYFFTICILNNW